MRRILLSIKLFGTVYIHLFWDLWPDPFVHNSSVFSLDTIQMWNFLQTTYSPDIIQDFILGWMQHCYVLSGPRAGWIQLIMLWSVYSWKLQGLSHGSISEDLNVPFSLLIWQEKQCRPYLVQAMTNALLGNSEFNFLCA